MVTSPWQRQEGYINGKIVATIRTHVASFLFHNTSVSFLSTHLKSPDLSDKISLTGQTHDYHLPGNVSTSWATSVSGDKLKRH